MIFNATDAKVNVGSAFGNPKTTLGRLVQTAAVPVQSNRFIPFFNCRFLRFGKVDETQPTEPSVEIGDIRNLKQGLDFALR